MTRICSMVRDWASATEAAATSSRIANKRVDANRNPEPEEKPIRLRNRECPDFTVVGPFGEQLGWYGARFGAWIDLTGKISTPSLLKKIVPEAQFLISNPIWERLIILDRTSPAQMHAGPIPPSTLQLRL